MTPEQEKEMREKFEAWAKTYKGEKGHGMNLSFKKPRYYRNRRTRGALIGFQAAYTPRLSVEAVAGILVNYWKKRDIKDFPNATTMPSDFHYEQQAKPLAQHLVDAIFNQQEKPCENE